MSEVPPATPAPPSLPEGGSPADPRAANDTPTPPFGSAQAPYAAGAVQGLPLSPADASTGASSPTPVDFATTYPGAPYTAAPKRRRLRWLWWTSGSLAFVALAGLCAYLVVVSDQWSTRVDELTAISGDLGQQVADQTAARQSAEAAATTIQSQLDTATARITDLANEEANATDHEGVWINLVDSMVECADGRQGLIDVLTNSSLYFPGKTNSQYESELTTYCDGVKADYTDFKTEIGK